ncbi:MAG: hypothetical protein RSB48_03940 [Akkermansia sp.]
MAYVIFGIMKSRPSACFSYSLIEQERKEERRQHDTDTAEMIPHG